MERRRSFTGWGVSVLLHACLLTAGVAWLLQPPRFHVEPGRASIELVLARAPMAPPSPVTTPPAPDIPVPPTLAAPPIPVAVATPQPAQPSIPALIEPTVRPPLVPALAAHSSPLSPASAHTRTAAANINSRASTGAIQAQPDDSQNEPPRYPNESRIAREEGMVILRVAVTAAGDPAAVSILQSSRFSRLDEAARSAVGRWKFHPAMLEGLPVASVAEVPVLFRLE
jgi:protein TonB